MNIIKDKFNIVGFALLIVICAFLIQLINLQVVNGERYEEESQQKLLRNRRIIAPRGNIYDRNGEPIAINRLSYSVDISKTIQTNDDLNDMLLELVKIFENNNDSYECSLSNYLSINPLSFGLYIKDSTKIRNKWIKDILGGETIDKKLHSPKDVFKYLKDDKFEISNKYNIEDVYKIMLMRYEILMRVYSILNSLTLAKDVSKATVAKIEEINHKFPGVSTNIEPMRKYLNIEPIAHVIGYVANINSEEYKQHKNQGYYMTDYIGKMGIEKAYEKDLRGIDGQLSLESDIWFRKSNQLKENKAKPGKDVTLTIDMKMQTTAMKSLEENIDEIRTSGKGGSLNWRDTYFGSAVAIDIHTGEILVMASYPSYDSSIFIADQKNVDIQKAIANLYDANNTTTSQYNRAISGIYPPGSTYKPLVGLAGLEENIIAKDTIIDDPGYMKEEGVTLKCLEWKQGLGAHGAITLKDGLKTSCNMFFYKLGMMIGIDKIDKWAKKFGFGEKVGIEIEGESDGIRSNPEYHQKFLQTKFGKVYTALSAIGQQYNLFTPLQLANYVSTLANGGKKYQPFLVKSIADNNNSIVKNTKSEFTDLKLNPNNINSVKEGMVAVTSEAEGTAVDVFKDFPYEVAAKTGTAQKNEQKHSDYGLFIAFAPANDPKIAVCVVIERGVYGAYAAPVARDILAEYFKVKKEDEITKESVSNNFELIR